MDEYEYRRNRDYNNEDDGIIINYERQRYNGIRPVFSDEGKHLTPEERKADDDFLYNRYGSGSNSLTMEADLSPDNKIEEINAEPVSSEKKENLTPVDSQDIAFSDKRNEAPISVEKRDIAQVSVEKSKDKKDEAPISVEKRDIANFSQAEKLEEVLKRTIQKLKSALGSQLKAMISPTSIAVMVGVLGAYAASHAVGIGFIADAAMLVSGGVFLG